MPFSPRAGLALRLTTPVLLLALLAPVVSARPTIPGEATPLMDTRTVPARDPSVPIDEEYTRKIKEYTTQPFFNSPLTDYLPSSPTVPTPKAVLGDVAGAPNKLPYTADVHRYMRLLEQSSPRVKVFSIGQSEEGREMIAVAVSSEANLAALDANRARLAQLADPRTINMNDAEADKLVAASVPVYYITGSIHSNETGSPTALMELAYRLAVDESAYVKSIRERLVTLITPVVETDGRDRMVDIYNWHLAHPKENYPSLLYWGRYVAHDNNRDAMALTLKLTRNVLATYLRWKPQVLHDLHESVAYLYDNTVGDEPYNAWVDPILTNEWQIIGWHNVAELTKYGMPGVFTHGSFDTWSPSYLMFIAASHNGISRLYETFGNGGADTVERTLTPDQVERTWYRQNPPLAKTMWSQRNNNNYQQTGLLVSLSFFADNSQQFLKNFYLKSKRSIEKPLNEGPAAYVLAADDSRPNNQAELLRTLQMQGCEVSRARAAFTVSVPVRRKKGEKEPEPATQNQTRTGRGGGDQSEKKEPATETRRFPAGSYVIRMDQPYSRIADMMLDYQYWSPNERQVAYDDTAWTFGELGNIRVTRVTDRKVLDVPVDKVAGEVRVRGTVGGRGQSNNQLYAVNHTADNALATLRFRLREADVRIAEEPFEAAGQKFNRGSFLLSGVARSELERLAADLGLSFTALAAAPNVKTHAAKLPRIAVMHTWISTQDEGWWRLAFDQLGIPYTYISTQDAARDANLKDKYDVIVFAPVGRGSTQTIVTGLPMWGNPLPWKTTELTPNLGTFTQTDDMRPGLGWNGLTNLQNFVRRGGLLIGAADTADFAVAYNFTPGVSTARPARLKVPGSVLRARFVDETSPIAYGYAAADPLSVFYAEGPLFNLSQADGSSGRRRRASDDAERATGRGTIEDPDVPQGRSASEPAEDEPAAEAWEAAPLTDEQRRNNPFVIPPQMRPRVVLRFSESNDLLVSGLLDGGGEVAERAAVIDVPFEQGHVVLFSNNPMWRGETQGSYFLVLNSILNFDNLHAGRKDQ